MISRDKLRPNLLCIYCSRYPHLVRIKIKNMDDPNDMRGGDPETNNDIGRIDTVNNLHKMNTPMEQIKIDLSQ